MVLRVVKDTHVGSRDGHPLATTALDGFMSAAHATALAGKLDKAGGDITGGLTVDGTTFVVDETTNRVGIGVASPVHRFQLAGPVVNGGERLMDSVLNIDNGLSLESYGAYRPFSFEVRHRATDVASSTHQVSQGVRSAMFYGLGAGGVDGVAAIGTTHGFTSETTISGSGSSGNEHAAYFGSLLYNIGTGYTQSVGPVGSAWLCDFNLHGPLDVQPNLLNGVVMFANNYYNGSPAAGESAGMWVVSRRGHGGGKDAAHGSADTYPMDIGIGIVGTSGTSVSPTLRQGYKKALRIGGVSSAWNSAPSRFGTGIEVSDFENFGIHVSGRYTGATGPALVVANGAGPALIGRTSAFNANSLLEVFGVGSKDPLVMLGSEGAADSMSVILRNGSGTGRWFVAGSAGAFLTGTAAGDLGFTANSAGKTIHIGGSAKVVSVTNDNKLGFFAAAPVARPALTYSRTGESTPEAQIRAALAALGLVSDTTTA